MKSIFLSRTRRFNPVGAIAAVTLTTLAMRGGAGAPASDPIFIESAATAGLAFTHVNGASGRFYLPEVMGSGVALFDYDNDGDLDVFVVQGGALDARASTAASSSSRLFRNDLTT